MDLGSWKVHAWVAAVMVTAIAASAAPAPARAKIKPDLFVQSCTASLIPPQAEMQKVRVTVRLGVRAAAKVSTGPFKVKVEWRSKTKFRPRRGVLGRGGEGWSPLPEAGVAGLTYDPARRRVPLATRTFTATVPWGGTYLFRATVDAMDQVDEADESNNTATTELRAAHCEAGQVDLVLTRIRLQRQPGGRVVVDAWARNTCSTACVTDVLYVVTETTASGLSRASINTIASRLDGDSAIGPVSANFPGAGDDAELTYSASIGKRGGACRETDTANNDCSGSLGAGETSKTITCHSL